MTTFLATRLVDLVKHHAAWDELTECCQGSGGLPMQGSAWIHSYFEHLAPASIKWCVIFVYDGNLLLGVLPVQQHASGRLSTPSNNHLLGTTFLVRPGFEREVCLDIFGRLGSIFPGWHDLFMSRVIIPEGLQELIDTRALGPTIEQVYGRGAFVDVSRDFKTLRGNLSRNFRNNLSKARNKLNSLDEICIAREKPSDLDAAAFDDFLELEGSGWKGKEATAIVMSRVLTSFYRSLCKRLATQGWLEWHTLRADNGLLAAHMAVRCGRSLLIWKLAYNEQYRHCSPGSLLMEDISRQACADPDLDEINLSTDQSWYANWRMEYRTYKSIRIYARRMQPLATGYFPRRMKQFLTPSRAKY